MDRPNQRDMDTDVGVHGSIAFLRIIFSRLQRRWRQPPGVVPECNGSGSVCITSPSDTTHPLTFKPEFVDAFELGTKNTLIDGTVTFNADIFHYKYQNYQISQIVDRTSVNLNFDANVNGAEVEATWELAPGLRFNFAGGYENATLADGSQAIDLMDRAAGQAGWMVVKPFITQT